MTRLGLLVLTACALAACRTPPPNTSGGPITAEQAAYDVRFYDLDLHIAPDERRIHGTLTADVEAVEPLRQVVFDLDDRLEVDRTWVASPGDERDADFEHRGGRLSIDLGRTATPGTRVRVGIDYGGRPRVAPRPPWEGGFTWAETASGAPWIGVSCQGEGADLWWPVKDHPSDEPDSMWIAVTVPDTLTAVSNGRLEQIDADGASHRTFRWRIGYPINPYAVTVNVAPYLHLVRPYESVSGAELPLQLWVLPERRTEGETLLEHYAEVMAFLERVLGPYPFPRDKAAVVHAPFLGMEHQTAVAYGGTFLRNIYSFDWLLLHELAHEWFGNRITVDDWRHLWIHEGFATYLEALYAEHLGGPRAGQAYLRDLAGRIRNERSLVPESPQTAGAMYFDASVRTVDADVYVKGAWVLHTLRGLIGDEAFFRFLRDLTASDTGPSVDTQDIVRRAEAAAGRPLDWFFDAYLRTPSPPHLVVEPAGDGTLLRWETALEDAFPLPVEVQSPDGLVRLEMRAGRGRIPGYLPEQLEIDPENRVLRR